MRKYLLILLAAATALCAVSCGKDDSSSDGAAQSGKEQTSQSENGGEESPYTLEADFSKGASDKFSCSDGWSNGNMFNCTWTKDSCTFEDGLLNLTINKNILDQYTAGEYRSNDFYHYGLYEVSMKPIKNNGVVSSMFTYTGPSDSNPWDEIDIEFLGKDTTKVQFNYYTDGQGGHEYLCDLGFDAAEDFHTYGFRWEKDKITWYVDGKEVYSATENLPSTPGKLMMNAWNGLGVDAWLLPYDGTVPLTAQYQWVRFTAEE